MPVFTPDLFRRIDRAEAAIWRAEESAAPSPHVRVKDFGGPLAFATLSMRNTLYNRVLCVGLEDAHKIAGIVSWYEELGVPPRFDVCPALRSKPLADELTRLGFEPGGLPFFSRRVMAGVPKAADGLDAQAGRVDVSVRPVESHEIEAFVSIQRVCWGTDDIEHALRVAKAKATHALPGIRRYFACVAGSPVAVGNLHMFEGVGYLNLAATLTDFRDHGCQTALLARRIADAAAAGCDLVTSLVSPDSASQRNIERAGLSVACDRELWMRPDWTKHAFYRDAL